MHHCTTQMSDRFRDLPRGCKNKTWLSLWRINREEANTELIEKWSKECKQATKFFDVLDRTTLETQEAVRQKGLAILFPLD